MSEHLDGGPAFPIPAGPVRRPDGSLCSECGMSLRDYFAATVLAAVLPKDMREFVEPHADEYAATAYEIADAMLRARRPGGELR